MRLIVLVLAGILTIGISASAQAQTTGEQLLDSLNAHIDARTDSLRQRVADLEAKVETLEGSDDDARLDALEGAFASIPDQLAALDIRVTDIEEWIASGTEPEPTPTPTPEPTPEPTPTPTPTPDPEPTRSYRCFSDPGACGFPDPDYGTVGVPAGTDLTPSGDIVVDTPGTVIENLEVRGAIRVAADNVTIRNVRLIGTDCGGSPSSPCPWLILNDGDYTTTVSHVEFTATMPTTVLFGIRNDAGGEVRLDHIYHHGSVSSICYCGSDNGGGTGVVTDSYSIIEDQYIPEDHLENIYADDSTLTVRHSVLLNSQPQTSTVFGNVHNGFGGACENKFTIDGNLLAGGGHMLTGCAHSTSNGTSDIKITNNRFARCGDGEEVQGGGGTWLCPGLSIGEADEDGYYPRGGSFVVCTEVPSNAVINGNVWDKDDSDADSEC